MGPLLQKFSDPKEEHDGTCRFYIPAQKGYRNRGSVQDRNSHLPPAQSMDALPDEPGRPAADNGTPNRHGKKEFPCHTQHNLPDQFILIVTIYSASGVLPYVLRHGNFLTGKLLEELYHIFSFSCITNNRVLAPLINLYSNNGRLAKQAVLQDIRVPARHPGAGNMDPQPSFYLMQYPKLHTSETGASWKSSWASLSSSNSVSSAALFSFTSRASS